MTPAERAVLSALLDVTGEGAGQVENLGIDPHDFSTPAGEVLFSAIVDTARAGKPTDPATIMAALHATGGTHNVKPGMLWEIVGDAVPVILAPHHAGIVSEESSRRRLQVLATSIMQDATNGHDVGQIIDGVHERLGKVSGSSSVVTEAITDSLDETIESLDHPVTFVESPWPSLNHLIHGWRKGGLYVIGARPSVGKTVAGFQAAMSLANTGAVAYTSLEMSAEELQLRMVSHRARVDMGHIVKHRLSNDEMRRIAEARMQIGHMPLYVDPSPDASFNQIARHAWGVKRKHGLSAVVVDYLGLIEGRPGQKEYEVVTESSRRLKLLAKSLDVPVIALSQLNRGSESRDEARRPRLTDLRSSGAIEQDADVVILLHRDLSESPHELDMIVAKNRQGVLGDTRMDFAGHYSEIRDGNGYSYAA